MDLTQKQNLGRLCSACGAPLRQRDQSCPRCGYQLGSPLDLGGHLMTPFGWGFCGVIAGMISGYAIVGITLPDRRFMWLPLAMALIGALVATGIGRHLEPQLRCSYEHLLLSAIAGGLVSLCSAVIGPLGLDTLALVWLGGVVASYALLRRYGPRPE
ncbi:MAG: zinc ribbon domain-containing protein [Armatimonadia bacterium]